MDVLPQPNASKKASRLLGLNKTQRRIYNITGEEAPKGIANIEQISKEIDKLKEELSKIPKNTRNFNNETEKLETRRNFNLPGKTNRAKLNNKLNQLPLNKKTEKEHLKLRMPIQEKIYRLQHKLSTLQTQESNSKKLPAQPKEAPKEASKEAPTQGFFGRISSMIGIGGKHRKTHKHNTNKRHSNKRNTNKRNKTKRNRN